MVSRKPSRLRRALTTLAVAAVAAVGLVATPTIQQTAHAETPPSSNTPTFAPDVFYVYVKKGEYLWYNFSGDNPPKYVLDEDGNVTNMTPWLGGIASHYAKHDGIFEVHYEPFIDKNNQYASNTQYSWNVQAVSHDDKTIPGRVWANKVFIGQRESFNWNNPSTPHPNSIGDFALTAVSPTGYQYQITAREYGGIQSVIAVTSSGINKIISENGQDYCKPTYKSYDNWYVSYGSGYDGYLPTGEESGYWVNHYRENYKCGQLYKLFFDTPAADLPKSIVPSLGVIPTPTVVVQSLDNKARAVISNLDRFTTYTFSANEKETPLQGYETAIVNIDTNGPVQWTLKANSGNEIHLMLSDVEMLGGLTIKDLNGTSAGNATVYWDDRNLITCRYVKNTHTPWEALEGVNSDTPSGAHGWNVNNRNPKLNPNCRIKDSATHGDGRIIDTWARSGESREWSGYYSPTSTEPSISLTKTVTEETYGDTSTELHWTYTATNTGNVPLMRVHLIDDIYSGGYRGTDSGSVNNITDYCEIVKPGDTCTWKDITSPLVDSDFPESGKKTIVNRAKARGTTNTDITVTSDPAYASSTYVPSKPAIEIEKTVDKSEFNSGDKLTWTFTVRNTGDISLHDVAVVEDSYNGHKPLSEVTCPGTTLAPGASMTCTATSDTDNDDIQRGDVTNTAHATGVSDGRNRKVESAQSTAKTVGKPTTPVTVITSLPLTGGTGVLTIAGIALVVLIGVVGLTITHKRLSNESNEN